MRTPRFFIDSPLAVGSAVELPTSTAHYANNVLRMNSGAEVVLFNGQGGEYVGKLDVVSKKAVTVKVESFNDIDRESKLITELAIGMSRGDRMDWVIQKATEMGVTKIVPLTTERTEVKLSGERLQKKLAHWQQVIVSACEQSRRTKLPELFNPQALTEFCQQCDSDRKLIFHGDVETTALRSEDSVKQVSLLIGPEGGLSDNEILTATHHGFELLRIGPRILRTETAPIAALTLVQDRWGDF